jgi:hypothetical protein
MAETHSSPTSDGLLSVASATVACVNERSAYETEIGSGASSHIPLATRRIGVSAGRGRNALLAATVAYRLDRARVPRLDGSGRPKARSVSG